MKNSLPNTITLENPIAKRIQRRLLKRDQNFLAFWGGPTGSGKTKSCTSFCLTIDADFTEANVIWTMKEFVTILKTRKLKDGRELKRGMCLLFDEFPTQVGARDWYSVLNKTCLKILQTFRDLGIGVFFTGPNISLADGKTELLTHAYFENDPDINYTLDLAAVYYNEIVTRKRKTYPKPYYAVHRAERIKIAKMLIGLPPQNLLDAILKGENEYKQSIRDQADDDVDKYFENVNSPGKGMIMSVDTGPMVQDVLSNPKEYISINRGKISIDCANISSKHKVSYYYSRIIRAEVIRKINKEEFVKNHPDLVTG